MSGVPLSETILAATNPASFAIGKQVFVYERGTTAEIPIFRDEALTESVTQPLLTDKGGRLREDVGGTVGTQVLFVAEGSAPDLVSGDQRVPLPPIGGGGLSKEEVEAIAEEKGGAPVEENLEASGMGVVIEGTASTPRPTGFKSVTWIQEEEPEHIAVGDVWIQV